MNKYLIFSFSIAMLLLLACEEESDYIPEAFSLGGIEHARVKTFYYSDTVTVSGITGAIAIQFDGIADGESYVAEAYINDTPVSGFGSSDLRVNNGDQVYVKVQSSEYYATAITTSITIGDQQDDFTITTQPLPLQERNYPGAFFYDLKAFAIDEQVYMGLGSDDADASAPKKLYAYDIEGKTWSEKAEFAGDADFSYLFSAGGKAYGGYDNAVMEYDPVADAWQRIENITLGEDKVSSSVFKVSDQVYALVDYTNAASKVWKFNTNTIAWESVIELNSRLGSKRFLFSIADKAYFRAADTEDLSEYDTSTHTFTPITTLPAPDARFGFDMQGKGYVCYTGTEGIAIYAYDPSANTFTEVSGLKVPNPPDDLRAGLSTGQHAFIITARYSGVLGAADLSELLFYEVTRN
ncbi:MAG: hypothetical protein RIG62_10110 [Cyclobacteriaceae bacterium]